MEQAEGAIQFYRTFLSVVDDHVMSGLARQNSESEKELDSNIFQVNYLLHDSRLKAAAHCCLACGCESARERVFNPRTPGGLISAPPPCGFSSIAKKRRREAPPNLAQLLRHQLYTMCEIFDPRSSKVRSPGQVT